MAIVNRSPKFSLIRVPGLEARGVPATEDVGKCSGEDDRGAGVDMALLLTSQTKSLPSEDGVLITASAEDNLMNATRYQTRRLYYYTSSSSLGIKCMSLRIHVQIYAQLRVTI